LLLSGILETERRSVEETFLELGATHLRSETMGDWCSILLQKPAP
jgi:ribosomal protein L11 methylase PrmA